MLIKNNVFADDRQPFRAKDSGLHLHHSSVRGPFSFCNPTSARFFADAPSREDESKAASSTKTSNTLSSDSKIGSKTPAGSGSHSAPYHYLWRSRDNRKGRHPIVIHKSQDSSTGAIALPARPTSHPSVVLATVWRMFTYYPVWDISWLVAYIFTWGSIVWCINAFFSFLPLLRPETAFPGESLYAGGISAFVGAVLFFESGSILLMFEAVNANNAGCFGWAVEQLVDADDRNGSGSAQYRLRPSRSHCEHHHRNKHNLVGRSATAPGRDESNAGTARSWRWFPTMSSLKSHYLHELGFLASFAQFCGATIFSLAGITALPGIYDRISNGVADGIYWAPQVVGGCGFIVSGTLYLLETQPNWYTPSLKVLGWHIAFWNLIGGIGFTLCGAFGFAAQTGSSWAEFQAACSTFWGSFAFLIGSLLQLYESLQKNPVEVQKQ